MVGSSLPMAVDSFDGSFVGLVTVGVALAVAVGTDCAVTPRSLFAATNNAPISNAAKAAAATARYPKRLFFAGV
jgi:hypothetical protein